MLIKVMLTGQPNHFWGDYFVSSYNCIGGCLVAQNTTAEIWSNAW